MISAKGLRIELFSLINVLNKKIDGVAADLTGHRADTERRSTYKVSESKPAGYQ